MKEAEVEDKVTGKKLKQQGQRRESLQEGDQKSREGVGGGYNKILRGKVGKGDRGTQGLVEEGEEKVLNSIQLSWRSFIFKSKEI